MHAAIDVSSCSSLIAERKEEGQRWWPRASPTPSGVASSLAMERGTNLGGWRTSRQAAGWKQRDH